MEEMALPKNAKRHSFGQAITTRSLRGAQTCRSILNAKIQS